MLLKYSLDPRQMQFFALYIVHVMAELHLLRKTFSKLADTDLAISKVFE